MVKPFRHIARHKHMLLFFHRLEMAKYGGRVYSCLSVYMFKASIKQIIEAFFFQMWVSVCFQVCSNIMVCAVSKYAVLILNLSFSRCFKQSWDLKDQNVSFFQLLIQIEWCRYLYIPLYGHHFHSLWYVYCIRFIYCT